MKCDRSNITSEKAHVIQNSTFKDHRLSGRGDKVGWVLMGSNEALLGDKALHILWCGLLLYRTIFDQRTMKLRTSTYIIIEKRGVENKVVG